MWVQSIERVDGELLAQTVSTSGSIERAAMHSIWRLQMPVPQRTKLRMVVNLSEWAIADAGDYLGPAGLNFCASNNTHEIYAFDYNGLKVLVPALALIKALAMPNYIFFDYIFRPSSLDFIVAPLADLSGITIATIHSGLRANSKRADSVMTRSRWMYCFPSARNAYDSVYSNAADGALAISRPKIKADALFRGTLRGNSFLVSTLTIQQFQPLEQAYDWAGTQPTVFEPNQSGHAYGKLNPRLQNAQLIEGSNGWSLSDGEWGQLRPLFHDAGLSQRTDQHIRQLLNAILTKLGTGVGWLSANANFGSISAVSSFYRQCRSSGRWQEFELLLVQIRKGKSIPPINLYRHPVPYPHSPRIRLRK